jgi:hypothetical protein
MRVRHGKELFTRLGKWKQGAEQIRTRGVTRSQAYSILHTLRANGALPGMGPAFYTELIFFLRGNSVTDPGYIMDQWTSCWVNILTGNPRMIKMDASYRWNNPQKLKSDFSVSEHNNAEDYEIFCCAIDRIADITSLPSHNAELLLMSRGRGKGKWRNYVISQRHL